MRSAKALRSALLFVATLMLCVSAEADLFRAYLASNGNDANPCTLAQPCRLLPAALAAVVDHGEIWMLDSANYNSATVTISKSVTILAVPGAVGSVVVTTAPAIIIAASNLTIALRNLVIVPLPPLPANAIDGVVMTGTSNLTIENSLLANISGRAVYVVSAGTVEIANTTIRNGGDFAVSLQSGASVNISNTKMLNNAAGGVFAYVFTASATTATVSDSIISGGGLGAVAVTTIAGGSTSIFLTRCTIQNTSTTALETEATPALGSTALIAVSSSMITNNSSAWLIDGTGATIRTLGNNHIADNLNPSEGTLTPSPLQ